MSDRVRARNCIAALGLVAGLGFAAVSWTTDRPGTPQLSAMSCFTVMGTMSCIDAAIGPVTPAMPPVLIPPGPGADGEHDQTTIRDDGGHEAARG
jgi:hypothetical protein